MKDGKCPKCGSAKIMANLNIRDKGHLNRPYVARVVVDEPRPANAGISWVGDGASGEVRAWVCSQCGYTEFYTENFENLYNVYQRFGLDNQG